MYKCPDCGNKRLDRNSERGEIVCSNCGLVVEEDLVQEGPEWRAFDAEQRASRARTGAPLKYMSPNKGLVTEIDQYNRDIRGGKIVPSQQAQLYRMRKWHKRASISNSIERNLAIALTELNRVASHLGLPESIRESGALLYRRCVEKGLIRGRQIESVVSAVLYAICRQYGIPRTLDEIAAVAEIPKKEIGRTYRLITQELDLKVPLTNPRFYISRFITSLKLSGETQEKAVDLLDKAIDKGLISGRGPMGVAAAAVYIASVMTGERRTQKEVADVAGVTEVTIRNRYRELKKSLDLDVTI
ncbi:transcription initiation factor IIB [Candidatus Micrarchaeota archaeon]|nr:transcription initiation factor IIB [Candidatus Micrarchaeota archaeon]MBI5177590.1 transcription initiation factor IIB [Candidatus Micrarchaeota archaeon]